MQSRGGPGSESSGGHGSNTSRLGGARGGAKVIIDPHKHKWFFVAKSKESMFVTKIRRPLVNPSPYTARNEISVDVGGDDVNTAKNLVSR